MALPAPGTQIGQYEIVAQVGTGGMATVFKAHHSRLDRDVAIKMMHSMFLTDSNFVARFEREARVVARLDHPNIVQVYDYDLYEGQPYLVMKLVEGRTLKDMLAGGALPLDTILHIIPSVAEALTYAHSQGVLHRDVKPSNIIIDNNGVPYLTDFGLARIARAGESTMSADMLLGTPYYISPEQAQGGVEVDSRADVYSLGVVLYELVVGRLPFTGDTPYIIIHKHIYESPTLPSQINPEIPPAVEYVLMKALAKDPADRYPTANALSEAFRQAVEESNLASLDDSRLEAARKFTPPVMNRPSGQGSPIYRKDSDGNFVTIPSPFDPAQPKAPDDSTTQSFAQVLSQDGLREIGQRFREAMLDIRDQIENRENLRQLREGAEKAIVEIKTQVEKAVEENGGDFKLNFGGGKPGTRAPGDTSARRASKVINRDWGTDENAIRHRVNERIKKRSGLVGHIITYSIVGTIFLAVNPAIQGVIADIFKGSETYGALATMNVALVVLLLWGGGLVANLIDVIYNTGTQLEKRRRAINAAMTRRYGENWVDVANDKEYKRVRGQVNKRFDNRAGFFQHFFVSVFTVLALIAAWGPLKIVLNHLFSDTPVVGQILQQNVPMLFALLMALTVAIHGIGVFLSPMVGDEARERALERELERSLAERPREGSTAAKAKNDLKLKNDAVPGDVAGVRLTEDGEFTDSFVESLDEDLRQGRR